LAPGGRITDHDQRDTDAPFGPEEADAIRAQFGRTPELACPRCGGPLVAGEPVTGATGSFAVFAVRCPVCRRTVFARLNDPE